MKGYLVDVTGIPDDDEADRILGHVIKLIRKDRGLTVEAVSKQTHIEEARILSLETGHADVSIKRKELLALCTLYSVASDELFDFLCDPPHQQKNQTKKPV